MKRNVPGLMLAMVGLAAVCILPTSCDDSSGSSSTDDGGAGASDGGGANNGGGAANGGGGINGGGGVNGGGLGGALMSCATGGAQCSDGIDNDQDGKLDMTDGECVSPCDNDEASFATGISGDNIDACKQDCFFDGDSGQGNDGCEWNLKCDAKNPGASAARPCPYDKDYNNCPTEQSAKCVKNCGSVTPNGCDCFGCCAFPSDNKTVTVRLVGTCTRDKLGDPSACPPCTQQTACVNTCEKCEVCIGKPQLEPECTVTLPPPDGGVPVQGDAGTPPPPTPKCGEGIISCGPGGQVADGACPANTYCLTGCCIYPLL